MFLGFSAAMGNFIQDHFIQDHSSSDVFSFGVLLLEMACGRKALDLLVDWVWELYTHASLLEVADPELGNEYDDTEMEKVLKLGLLCSNAEPNLRPGIRQVCQILEGETTLPEVHMDLFRVNGCAAGALFNHYTFSEEERRLRILQVCQILEGEAPMPDVHMDSFSVNGFAGAPDQEDRLLQEIQSGNQSNRWLNSTPLAIHGDNGME